MRTWTMVFILELLPKRVSSDAKSYFWSNLSMKPFSSLSIFVMVASGTPFSCENILVMIAWAWLVIADAEREWGRVIESIRGKRECEREPKRERETYSRHVSLRSYMRRSKSSNRAVPSWTSTGKQVGAVSQKQKFFWLVPCFYHPWYWRHLDRSRLASSAREDAIASQGKAEVCRCKVKNRL